MKRTDKKEPQQEPSVRRTGGFRWWPVLLAMVLPFFAALFYFVLFSQAAWAQVLYGATKLFQVIWPVGAAVCLLGQRVAWRELWPPGSWKALPLGTCTGLAIVALIALAWQTPVRDVVAGSEGQIRAKIEPLGLLEWYWTFGLFLSLIHSFLEEYYWRWFVFGQLGRRLPVGWAHLLAGVAFAAHHVIITTQYFGFGWGLAFGGLVGVGGVLWSLLYVRQGTLAGAWISHVMVDLGVLAVGHKILFDAWI